MSESKFFFFFQFHEAADCLINTSKLNISKVPKIRVTSIDPTRVQVNNTHEQLKEWVKVKVLKKGKSLSDLKSLELVTKNHEYSTQQG